MIVTSDDKKDVEKTPTTPLRKGTFSTNNQQQKCKTIRNQFQLLISLSTKKDRKSEVECHVYNGAYRAISLSSIWTKRTAEYRLKRSNNLCCRRLNIKPTTPITTRSFHIEYSFY
jgi:hypothetical protein